MKNIDRKVWVTINEKGKVHDCSTVKDWVEKDGGDVLTRGTLIVEVPKPKPKAKKVRK